MSINFKHLVPRGAAFSAVILCLMGCGETQNREITQDSTACPSQTAQIQIGDGYSKILCGCSESAARIDRGSTTRCSISKGSTVHFVFSGATTSHQIISTGTPSFSSSPVSDPKDSVPYSVHPVTFSESGNFIFKDAFDEQIQGAIAVQ